MVFVAGTCAVFSGVKSIFCFLVWLQQQLLCFCCRPIQIKYNHQHSRLLLSKALWSRLELVGSWQESNQLWLGNIEKWKVGKFEELKSSISLRKNLNYIYIYIYKLVIVSYCDCIGNFKSILFVCPNIFILELHLFLMSLCSVKWGGNSWSPFKLPHKEYLKFKPLS